MEIIVGIKMKEDKIVYRCDNCGDLLGEYAYTCKGYTYICCTSGCLANLILIVQKVKTKEFFRDEIFSIKNIVG